MIKSYKFKGWRVSCLEGIDEARELFEAFLSGKIPEESITVLSNGTTGKVRKIEFRGKTYVLKHDLRKSIVLNSSSNHFSSVQTPRGNFGNWTKRETLFFSVTVRQGFFFQPTRSVADASWRVLC